MYFAVVLGLGSHLTANDLISPRRQRGNGPRNHGHVTTRMTEHYSHVDTGEKSAAVSGMLKLVRSAEPAPQNQDEVESTDGATATRPKQKAARTFEILPP